MRKKMYFTNGKQKNIELLVTIDTRNKITKYMF